MSIIKHYLFGCSWILGLLVCLRLNAVAQLLQTQAPALMSDPYVIAVSTDRASVCWQTVQPSAGGLSFGVVGNTNITCCVGPMTNFHAVTLTELKPGMKYNATVSSGARKLGHISFTTAPEKSDSFSFYVYGDTRTYVADHELVAKAIAAEARRLDQHTFVVHTGDFAEYESSAEQVAAQFFVPAGVFLEDMSLVPARGNHEGNLFGSYFPCPARSIEGHGADDYFLDYGSVRIVILDQYSRNNMDSRMNWIAGLLAGARDKWRFVVFHEPIYSTGTHGGNDVFRRVIEPVLQEGRVHAVFCGHDHNYERTIPIGGVTYFTAGGGGAPLRPKRLDRNPPEWSAKFEAVHHFITVSVTPERCTVRALGRGAGKGSAFDLFDQIEIPRECGWHGKDAIP